MNEFKGVIVDAGHGGIDSGAVGNNLEEKNLNLQAATYIFNRLQELGIPSKMTRTDDEYLPKNERIKRVLSLYNNNPNTILISNHINAGGGEGAEVVYSLKNDNTLANLILNNLGDAGQLKRKAYQRRLPENPNKDYYYILRETGNTEPVLIEYGFIDNKNDSKKLQENLEEYAEAVVKAICEYLGFPYTSNEEVLDSYIVQKGDTLYSLSKRFNIPISELKRINNLTSDTLSINQVLYLQEQDNNQQKSTYKVKRGDTLYSISKQYNIPITEIIKLNNLDNNILSIGQELILSKQKNDEFLPEQEIYIVQKGDSIWKISQKYNISPAELININNLSNNNLQIGQELLVPKIITEENDNEYIVQKGDTIFMGNNE